MSTRARYHPWFFDQAKLDALPKMDALPYGEEFFEVSWVYSIGDAFPPGEISPEDFARAEVVAVLGWGPPQAPEGK